MVGAPTTAPKTSWLAHVDRLLRGQLTGADDLRAGRGLPAAQLAFACVVLGTLYGAMMGLYSVSMRGTPGAWQVLSSAIKVPLLFGCTLVVTLPSLYVVSALARSRLDLRQTASLLIAAIAVNLALLASFGPITAFFTFSTDSYAFMIVLNVFFFGISGFVGARFLWRALSVVIVDEPVLAPEQPPADDQRPIATAAQRSLAAREGRAAGYVFRFWIIIYGVVGAQLGWILRPFIGNPELPLAVLRQREDSFLTGFVDALVRLLD